MAAIALALVLSLIGTACSAVNPQVLNVGNWSLSESDFQSQLKSFAKVYEGSGGATSLRSADSSSWATSYTSAFLNDQMNLQVARAAAEKRGIVVTDADRANAKTVLEQNFTNGGTSSFGDLPLAYQQTLIEGIAAQNLLGEAMVAEAQSEDALRRLYDSAKDQYMEEMVCSRHILVLAGGNSSSSAPTDAQYAAALTSIKNIQAEVTASNFSEIASAKSDDTGSARNGGELGCTPKGAFVTEFDDAAWAQPVGVVGQPVKTDFGYHLVLVSARGVLTFDQLKDSLKQAVLDSAQQLIAVELTRFASELSISVDGRYGQLDTQTWQITVPATSASPSTSVAPLRDSLTGPIATPSR